jgi:hypothetical protein
MSCSTLLVASMKYSTRRRWSSLKDRTERFLFGQDCYRREGVGEVVGHRCRNSKHDTSGINGTKWLETMNY